MRKLLRELTGYTVASLCALAVDVFVLWVLVQLFSFGYLKAATLSFLAGAGVAYVLSVRIAFNEHRMDNRRIEFLSFVVLGAVGLILNAMIMAITLNLAGLHYLIGKSVAAACTFACNFILRRHFLFVRPGYLAERRLAP